MRSHVQMSASLVGIIFIWFAVPLFGQDVIVTKSTSIRCPDGLVLEGAVDLLREQTGTAAKRVIILVPGSGAHSMDVDLSIVTKDKKENLVFKTIGRSLAAAGFTVVRYNKRNYQIQQLVKNDPDAAETKKFIESLNSNPLKHFVGDVLTIVKTVQKDHPNANIYLLGHSEGTYVALQAADQNDAIKGVGLIGFAEYSTDTLVFEQAVYRPLHDFRKLDANLNDALDRDELAVETPLAIALSRSLEMLDFNGDGQLARDEFKAANFANLLVHDTFGSFRKQEALYPRVAEILKSADFKVAFFQGMLDNQTPAYHTMAFELLLKQMGKAKHVRFNYFPGLGHALDPRDSYADLSFSEIDPEALKVMSHSLSEFFVGIDESADEGKK